MLAWGMGHSDGTLNARWRTVAVLTHRGRTFQTVNGIGMVRCCLLLRGVRVCEARIMATTRHGRGVCPTARGGRGAEVLGGEIGRSSAGLLLQLLLLLLLQVL